MGEIAALVKSPAFWFGTVVVGLAINIISAYLKAPIDTFLAPYSQSRKRKAAYRAASFRMDIERLALDADYMQMMSQTELRLRFYVVTLMLLLVLLSAALNVVVPYLYLDKIGKVGVYGGMGMMALALGTNLVFAVSEARVLSYKLRAAVGLKWRFNKNPLAKTFDILAEEDQRQA